MEDTSGTFKEIFKKTRKCYRAVMEDKWKEAAEEFTKEEVASNYLKLPVTSTKDTALHLAVHSGEEEPTKTLLLVAQKLEMVGELAEDFWKNNYGNTPLHEAARVGNLGAVKLLVEFKKRDMLVKNKNGETPLYRAAKYGQLPIVEYFLDDCEDLYSRSPVNWTAGVGETPIIHAAIQSEDFEMVWKLVNFDESLLKMKNSRGETALHVLANMPHVFESAFRMNSVERIIYRLLPEGNIYKSNFGDYGSFDDNDSRSSTTKNREIEDLEAGCNPSTPNHRLYLLHGLKSSFWKLIMLGWPQWKELYKKKQKHKLAITLVLKLANIDDSWLRAIPNPENAEVAVSKDVPSEDRDAHEKIIHRDHHETPLFLATARGILEVVQAIIEVDPQAIDCVSTCGRNILHLAIVHRRRNIYLWLEGQKLAMARLISRTDTMGFTILHQVGITKFVHQDHHGPGIQLHLELGWFHRVHKVVPSVYDEHQNNAGWKPREFFDETHNQLLEGAKEWVKKTSETCSAIALVVSTVVFASAFSVPGGFNDKTGAPVLLTQPLYMVFTIMDIAGLTTSLCSVVIFISIFSSSFRMDCFRHTVPMKLSSGFLCLFCSIACMMMAFSLAVVLTMKSTKMKWAVSFLYLAIFLPVSTFIIIQLPFYMRLMKIIWYHPPQLWDLFPKGLVTPFLKVRSKLSSKKST